MAVDPDFPTLSSPRSTNVKQSKATNGSDANVGRLSAQTSAVPSDTRPSVGGRWSQVEPAQARGRRVASRRVISRMYEGQDKENHVAVEPGWTTVVAEEPRDRPVGLGVGRDMGRDMGNVTHLPDEAIKGKKDKDKKARRAYLLHGPISRLTFSL